jgi:hypothetical protein
VARELCALISRFVTVSVAKDLWYFRLSQLNLSGKYMEEEEKKIFGLRRGKRSWVFPNWALVYHSFVFFWRVGGKKDM